MEAARRAGMMPAMAAASTSTPMAMVMTGTFTLAIVKELRLEVPHAEDWLETEDEKSVGSESKRAQGFTHMSALEAGLVTVIQPSVARSRCS